MPKVVITHKAADVENWQRAMAFDMAGTKTA
jgi:hypothetical protein